MRFRPLVPIAAVIAVASALLPAHAHAADPLTFAVRVDPGAYRRAAALGLETPLHGRLLLVISRTADPEPRRQVGVNGVPFWGMDVRDLDPDATVIVDATGAAEPGRASPSGVIGYPLASFDQIPAGDYFVQALLNVYTRFPRADGHRLEMHLNSGAGQQLFRAPGNLYSKPIRMHLNPRHGSRNVLRLDQVIEPIEPLRKGEVLQQGNPRDRGDLRFVKIRSAAVSEFWGRDMFIGANVLLPADYDRHPDTFYPVLYLQGHFPGRRAPFGYGETEGSNAGADFDALWKAPQAPQMIIVSIRDANPYYDTSYSVDSANVGPYGRAITTELIPYLESRFRIIPEPWARATAGGSTGGWEALAMQILYPDLFGGTWGWCPDPVDFNYYQAVSIYEDDNAYTTGNEWHRIERPNSRRPDGSITSTMRQENTMELARGPDSRSGGQWAIWQAVFGPVGENGYPQPIWDPVSGAIDHSVADYWRDHYDLHRYLRRNWSRVGPSLSGKIHVAVGDMDTYYLEEAVYLLQDFLDSVQDPPAKATFEYGRRKPHCWIGSRGDGSGRDLTSTEFVRRLAAHFREAAPNSDPASRRQP